MLSHLYSAHIMTTGTEVLHTRPVISEGFFKTYSALTITDIILNLLKSEAAHLSSVSFLLKDGLSLGTDSLLPRRWAGGGGSEVAVHYLSCLLNYINVEHLT